MSKKYLITDTGTLIFTSKPKSLKEHCVKKEDKELATSVIIPNVVSTIGEMAFRYFHSLASVHIPSSVFTVCQWAFNSCSALASVHIPNSVKNIGVGAFVYCPALASVHIPSSVSTIRCDVFHYCRSLASVHISNSVSSINAEAFHRCSRLHKFFVPSNSKIDVIRSVFETRTSVLRPRLKSIISLQKKPACRANKTTFFVYL